MTTRTTTDADPPLGCPSAPNPRCGTDAVADRENGRLPDGAAQEPPPVVDDPTSGDRTALAAGVRDPGDPDRWQRSWDLVTITCAGGRRRAPHKDLNAQTFRRAGAGLWVPLHTAARDGQWHTYLGNGLRPDDDQVDVPCPNSKCAMHFRADRAKSFAAFDRIVAAGAHSVTIAGLCAVLEEFGRVAGRSRRTRGVACDIRAPGQTRGQGSAQS